MKKMNEELNFLVEKYENRFRFIISGTEGEIACRKEFPKKIDEFLNKKEDCIFKGRIQLSKQNSKITVWFKKQPVGSMNVMEFKSLLPF